MSFDAEEHALALFQRGLDADDQTAEYNPCPPGEERDPEMLTVAEMRLRSRRHWDAGKRR